MLPLTNQATQLADEKGRSLYVRVVGPSSHRDGLRSCTLVRSPKLDSKRKCRVGHPPLGFTLVELLVVIAIIGILVSLLLPSVQQSREAARRIQCVSQLKQLALAVQNYESTHTLLPPSGDAGQYEVRFRRDNQVVAVYDQWVGRQYSWIVFLLPFLEENNLYDQFDLRRDVFSQPTDPQAQQIASLLCPSDAARGRYFEDTQFSRAKRFAKGNYAAMVSPYHTDLQLFYRGALVAEPQGLNRVLDGTSKTLMLSEVRTLDQPRDERGVWALPWNGATQLAVDLHFLVREKYLVQKVDEYFIQAPNTIGPNLDILAICDEETLAESQLQGMPCQAWENVTILGNWVSAAPRSMHPGGVNGAYLDGHVEFVTNDVHHFTFASLVGIDDEGSIAEPEQQAGAN